MVKAQARMTHYVPMLEFTRSRMEIRAGAGLAGGGD
jgi:hypothetical protein